MRKPRRASGRGLALMLILTALAALAAVPARAFATDPPPPPPVCSDPASVTLRPDAKASLFYRNTGPGPGHCENAPSDNEFTLRITQQPAHGTLVGDYITRGVIDYKPESDYSGPDSFKYVIANRGGESNELTQQFTVDPAYNRAPYCYANLTTAVVRVGASKVLLVNCGDLDGDPITFSFSETRGTIEENVKPDFPHPPAAHYVRYTAPADPGDRSDDYSFSVVDDRGARSSVVEQDVTVNPADYNDPPTCQAQWDGYSGSVASGNSGYLYPRCADPDDDPFTLAVTTQPEHGSVKLVSKTFGGSTTWSFLYRANGGFVGDDSFTYTATDDRGDSSTTTGVVHVLKPPPPFCASTPEVHMRTNGHRTVGITCFSSFPGTGSDEPVTYTITQQPAHGQLDFSGGASSGHGVYTPDKDFEGSDTIKLKASNSGGDSPVQTIAIEVAPGYNQEPYCTSTFGFLDGDEVRGEGSRELSIGCSDPDEDPLAITFSKPGHGTLSGYKPPPEGQPFGAAKITYTPDPGYRGADSFTFRASDGLAQSGEASARVKVVEPTANQAPSCVNGSSTRVAANSSHTFAPYERPCWDADGDELTYAVVAPPQHGTLSGPDEHGAFTYKPSNDAYTGEDSFTLAAGDGHAPPVTARMDVDITPAAAVTAEAPPLPSGGPARLSNFVDGDGKSQIEVPRAEVRQFPNDCMPLDVDTTISPGSNGGAVSDVELVLAKSDDDPGRRYAMAPAADGHWTAQIDCVDSGRLSIEWSLTENGATQRLSKPLGGLVLIDPQGVVYDKAAFDNAVAHGKSAADARTAAALEGATVVLQRRSGDSWADVPSGDPGIAPNANPQLTHPDGVFRWDVAAGTYRVVVSRPGYATTTSGGVNIPPAVTDLHVAMSPASAGGDGGAPQPGPPGGGGQEAGGGTPPVVTPPRAKKPCAGLKGKKRARCESRQRLKRALAKCSKVKGKKRRATCVRRARARARCDRLSGRKKTRCVRRANAIGRARR